MRKLAQGSFQNLPPYLQQAFNEIYRASQEADVVDIGAAYTITGAFTETRTLNVASPTIANVAAVLATLLADLKRGGATKTT